MANDLDNMLRFHTEALNLRAYRQELLAANIANADTPGYKARDFDFSKTLQTAIAGGQPAAALARTSAAHLEPADRKGPGGAQAQYRTVVQPSLDGNTVDMDVERAHFAENAIHYEANLMFINGQLKNLLAAIQG